MKIIGRMQGDLPNAPSEARNLEAAGFDALSISETAHDAFLPLVLAAEHTRRLEIWTSIAVAFARNPMNLAMLGHDLHTYSKGRFVMGLGSQVEAHITRRFSMSWGKPAARMKELISAIHAIWDNWYEAKPLRFQGEFFTHTLMTPAFTPTDTAYGRPSIVLAAVGPKMTEVAAEVADGIVCHAFTTERYLRQVTLPIVTETLTAAGRERSDFQVSCSPFIAMGETESEREEAKAAARKLISFYGSTPAYRGVLELHGWGHLQKELTRLSKLGQWDDMAAIIDDDTLATFVITGTPDEVASRIRERYSALVDAVAVVLPGIDRQKMKDVVDRIKRPPALIQ